MVRPTRTLTLTLTPHPNPSPDAKPEAEDHQALMLTSYRWHSTSRPSTTVLSVCSRYVSPHLRGAAPPALPLTLTLVPVPVHAPTPDSTPYPFPELQL